MSNSVIDKYLTKKKRDLVEYAKVLETLITLEKNSLWKTKQEFNTLAKEIADYYVEHFYFDNNAHRDNPVEYSNDNINSVLKSLIEYCKKSGKTKILQERKNETFLLSVIMTTACYVDIAANVVDGDFNDVKNKFKYLLQYLQKTNILKIYINNSKAISNLFAKIRTNINKEEKFFKAFENENSYNIYRLYTKEPDYHLVSYFYKVEGLDEYDEKMVKRINQEFSDSYLRISYELLAIKLLEELLGNGEVKQYLIPVTSSAIKKESSFGPLEDERLMPYFKVIVPFEKHNEYKEYITKLESKGIHFVYNFDSDEEVSQNTFLRNMDVIISKEFEHKNEDKMYSWKNQGINFIIKNKEEDVQ